jgi:DNA-binding transcriptional ArsR family regulator
MPTDTLVSTFAAFADPTRRAILARVASGARRPSESWRALRDDPARGFQAPQGAGACRPYLARPRGAVRPCRLEAAPLREVSDWVEQYRGFWEQSFDRLDEYLRELRRGEN